MKGRFNVQNFYKTTLASQIPSGTATDTTEKSFTISEAPQVDSGWLVVDLLDPTKTEIIFFHRSAGNVLYYYEYNRSNPNISHDVGAYVQMNDVAELFNYAFRNIDDFGQVTQLEKPGLRVEVKGGNIKANNQDLNIQDTILTLTDNTTNYIVIDYTDNTIKAITDLTGFTGVVLSEVITLNGDISSITDKRQHNLPFILDGVTLEIVNGKVEIKDLSIGTNKLTDLSVTTDKLADNSVTNSKIADASVDTNKITDNSITTSKIADGSVTTGKLADGNVTNIKIQDGAVDNIKITGPIDWNKISKTGSSLNDIDDVDTTGVQNLQGIFYDATTGKWKAGGSISTNKFTGLIDTPTLYPSDGKTYQVQVKSTNDGLEFTRDIDVNSISINGASEMEPGGLVITNSNGDIEAPTGKKFVGDGSGLTNITIDRTKNISTTYITKDNLQKGDTVIYGISSDLTYKLYKVNTTDGTVINDSGTIINTIAGKNFSGIVADDTQAGDYATVILRGLVNKVDLGLDPDLPLNTPIYIDNNGKPTIIQTDYPIGVVIDLNNVYIDKVYPGMYTTTTIVGSSLETGLLAYYELDGNANDSLGTTNGTINGGITFVNGLQNTGQAITGNNLDGYVYLGVNPFTAITNQFTIACWVYVGVNTGDLETIFSFAGSSSSVGSYNTGIYLNIDFINSHLVSRTGKGLDNSSGIEGQIYNFLPILGKWGLWILTMNDTEVNLEIRYTDGTIQTGSGTAPSGNILWNTGLYAYGNHSIGSLYSNGSWINFISNTKYIDKLGVWNRVLTTTEIDYLFNNGYGIIYNL